MNASSLAYAKEVYAACATTGYKGEDTDLLKQMIDDADSQLEVDERALVALAQETQLASIKWVERFR